MCLFTQATVEREPWIWIKVERKVRVRSIFKRVESRNRVSLNDPAANRKPNSDNTSKDDHGPRNPHDQEVLYGEPRDARGVFQGDRVHVRVTRYRETHCRRAHKGRAHDEEV